MEAAAQNKLYLPGASTRLCLDKILAIAAANTELQLVISHQLPFPYVHLLTVVIKVTLFFIAAQVGYQIGSLAQKDNPYLLIVVNSCSIVLINFFYQGLLNLFAVLSRPFYDHPSHLARHDLLKGLRRYLS